MTGAKPTAEIRKRAAILRKRFGYCAVAASVLGALVVMGAAPAADAAPKLDTVNAAGAPINALQRPTGLASSSILNAQETASEVPEKANESGSTGTDTTGDSSCPRANQIRVEMPSEIKGVVACVDKAVVANKTGAGGNATLSPVNVDGQGWSRYANSAKYKIFLKLYGNTNMGDEDFSFVPANSNSWLTNPQTGRVDNTLWQELKINTDGTFSDTFNPPDSSNLPDGLDIQENAYGSAKKLAVGIAVFDLAGSSVQVTEGKSQSLTYGTQGWEQRTKTFSCVTLNEYTEAHVMFKSTQDATKATAPSYEYGDRIRIVGNGWCNRSNSNQRMELKVYLDDGEYYAGSNNANDKTWANATVQQTSGGIEFNITLPGSNQGQDAKTGLATQKSYPEGSHTVKLVGELYGADGAKTGEVTYTTNPFQVKKADSGTAKTSNTKVLQVGKICYPSTAVNRPLYTVRSGTRTVDVMSKPMPSFIPAPPVSSPDELTAENSGGLTATQDGTLLTINVPDSIAVGDWVFVYAWYPETAVGWVQVGQDRVVKIDIRNMRGGEVKVSLQGEDGKLIGWVSGTSDRKDTELRNAGSGTVTTIIKKNNSGLSDTEWWLLGAAFVILVAVGLNAALFWDRRRQQRKAQSATAQGAATPAGIAEAGAFPIGAAPSAPSVPAPNPPAEPIGFAAGTAVDGGSALDSGSAPDPEPNDDTVRKSDTPKTDN